MVLVVVIETQSPWQALPVPAVPNPCCPSARIDGVLCLCADQEKFLYRRKDAIANAKLDPVEGRGRESHVPKWLRQVAV